jgi:hypothetical protein
VDACSERRAAHDVIDGRSGKVRVLSSRCGTCIFRPGNPLELDPGRTEEVISRNVAAGALLTCHSTLPYGPYPEFGPAVCAGFWARHGLETAAGRIAKFMLGIVRIKPPEDETAAVTAGEEDDR